MTRKGLIYSRYRGDQPANADCCQAEYQVAQIFFGVQIQWGLEDFFAKLPAGTIKVGCDGGKTSQGLNHDLLIVSAGGYFFCCEGDDYQTPHCPPREAR